MTVSEALAGVSRLGLDTSPFIYFVERHVDLYEVCFDVFAAVAAERITVCTSSLALTETLVRPIQANDALLQQTYRDLFTRTHRIELVPVGALVADLAAQLRSHYAPGLRTPDAVQVAAASTARCEAFLTNDERLERIREIPVLVAGRLEPAAPPPLRAP